MIFSAGSILILEGKNIKGATVTVGDKECEIIKT